MVNARVVRTIVGTIGNVISFGLFLSPAPTFYRIIKKKSVEEFQPYPYIATVMNCMLWVFYGLPVVHEDSYLVSTINGVGLFIEFIYLIIFFIYSGDKINTRRNILVFLLVEIIGLIAVILIALKAFHSPFAKQTFVGVICDVFNIAMYGSPCLIIRKVVQTKSVEFMPLWLSLISCINAACWTAYSLIHKIDLYLLISNGLGTLLTASQLIVYALYCNAKPTEKAAVKKSEVELSGPDRA